MRIGRLASVLAAFSLAVPAGLLAQQPTPAAPAPMMRMESDRMDEAMMARHREMMARMDAMDARLDDLVKKMDAARGSRKADAVAAVVSELVSQRKEMREHMMTMMPEMMHHMMEHMRMGMEKGVMECPMMKRMGSMPEGGKPEEHPGHH